MKDMDGKFLAQMLFTNETLKILDLSNNQLGAMTAVEFGLGLCYNTTLTKLDLSNNKLTNDGANESGILEFFDCITVNRTLESLDISNNNIGQRCCEKLREALTTNFGKIRKHKIA